MNNIVKSINDSGRFLPEKYMASITGICPGTHTIYCNKDKDLNTLVPFSLDKILNSDYKLDFDFIYYNSNKNYYQISSSTETVDNDEYINSLKLVSGDLIILIESRKITLFFNPNKYPYLDIIKIGDIIYNNLPDKVNEDETARIQLVTYNNYYGTIDSEIKATNVDIDKNYNEDFKPVYNQLINFIHQRETGIAMLSGIPGTGKTTLLKSLITKEPASYYFITPSVAASMGNPDFVEFLIENKNSIFILEDCEQLLQERATNSWCTSLANILNMTDGILSDIFNIKFICTFNASETTIDPALLREGRCYVNYKFDKLKADKVAVLNKENNLGIPEDEICDMTLAELYNYSGKKETKKKIGF